MNASVLASAESWLSIIGSAKLIAAFLVAIGVAIEFGGDWVAKPFEKIIEDARKLELAELHKESDDAKLETARLSKEAESSKAAIADANARALEAQAALEKYKQPRNLDIDSFLKILKQARPANVEVLYVRECSDCSWTAQFIGSFLNTAGWSAVWAAIDEKKAAAGPWRFQPVAVSVKGYPWGITVVAKDITPETLQGPKGASVMALFEALGASYKPSVTMAFDDSLPEDLIRVVVAPKP